jgi:hypothetical protein
VARYLVASIFQVQNLISPRHADAVLLIATTMEPAKRLGFEAEGTTKACLDATVRRTAYKCMLTVTVWVSLFPLAVAVAVPLEVLPEELS